MRCGLGMHLLDSSGWLRTTNCVSFARSSNRKWLTYQAESTDTEEASRDDWHDPGNAGFGGPAKEEKADG